MPQGSWQGVCREAVHVPQVTWTPVRFYQVVKRLTSQVAVWGLRDSKWVTGLSGEMGEEMSYNDGNREKQENQWPKPSSESLAAR